MAAVGVVYRFSRTHLDAMRDWDACYQSGETPWDKGRPAPPLLELMDRHGPGLWGSGPLLVPGCGFGHDVRKLAELGLPVLGLDISETAVAKTREVPAVGDEWYETGDFLDPAWCEGRRFSAIWEHTCFCAIDPSQRSAYAASVASLLDTGGILVGVFYLEPYDPGEDETGPPFKVSSDEIDRFFAADFERVGAWVPQSAFPGREGREWLAIFRKLPSLGVAG